MIDNFSLALTHGLLLLMAWRLLRRPDLDSDDAKPGEENRGFGFRRKSGDEPGA